MGDVQTIFYKRDSIFSNDIHSNLVIRETFKFFLRDKYTFSTRDIQNVLRKMHNFFLQAIFLRDLKTFLPEIFIDIQLFFYENHSKFLLLEILKSFSTKDIQTFFYKRDSIYFLQETFKFYSAFKFDFYEREIKNFFF